VFQKQLTLRGYPPLWINFLTYAGLSVTALPLALTLNWQLPFAFWGYAALGGIVGATGNGFLVKALEKGDLSVLGPINAYKSVIGLISGIFLLGELPSLWGIVGMLLIIGGSYFVLDSTEQKFSMALWKRSAIRYRIVAMVLTAIEAVFLKKMILLSTSLHTFIIWCWTGVFFSFLLLKVYRIHVAPSPTRMALRPALQYVALLACIALMQFTTIYVFDHMPVGYALALFQLSMLLTVWLGYHFFQEKDLMWKLIGSVIMVAGSVCVILF
jgi:drug/metabolite transporter (DMT)-like permease